MESADPAEKFAALGAELAAKSSRIAELEARVSLLEAENARLRRAMAKGEAPYLQGEEDPIFGRLVESPCAHKQTAAEKPGAAGACDVIVLSDGEEGIAVDDADKGRCPEVGAAAVPTTRKRAVRVATGESEEVEGGRGNEGIAHGDSNSWLDDDDVLVTTRGKERATAARVVTSDSEDEDGGELGRGDNGQEEGASPSRKRARCGIIDSDEEDGNEGVHVAGSERSRLLTPEMEIEDDDDRIPISQAVKKFRKERASASAGADDEFSDAKECSTPVTRRSARLVKNQSKKGQAARRMLSFVEPKEYEESGDDMEEDSDMDDFINDGDYSEHASGSAEGSCAETEVSDASAPDEEESSPEPEDSDSEVNYADVMASIGRKRKTQDWKFEGEMLAAFDEHPELCLKAVCALYRRQTEEEQREKATIVHNKEGFSQIDAPRASCIAEFLLDGDLYGPLKKTIRDLEGYDRYAFEFCRKVASRYSKQLFAIYQNKEDSYFHP